MSDLEKHFGRKLKKLRQAKKFSQEQLAERLEIGPTTVSKIENGKSFVTSDTLEKIIKSLDIKPYELFLFEKEEPVEVLYDELIKNLKADKIRKNAKILNLLLEFTNCCLDK